MPRRSRHDNGDSFLTHAYGLFMIVPTWVGPVVAVVVFVAGWMLAPIVAGTGGADRVDVSPLVRPLIRMGAGFFAIATLVAWVVAEAHKLSRRRMLDAQTGIDSIRELSWREFEHLVCEAYKRQGYVAEVVGGDGPDGGVDVELRKPGEGLTLVQCKQWPTWKVKVNIVRELLGVVVSRGAKRGILITSGRLTEDARDFVRANRQLEVVEDEALERLIVSAQTSGAGASMEPSTPAARPTTSQARPLCPICGSGMIVRDAKKGVNAGTQFLSCAKWPNCRGKRDLL